MPIAEETINTIPNDVFREMWWLSIEKPTSEQELRHAFTRISEEISNYQTKQHFYFVEREDEFGVVLSPAPITKEQAEAYFICKPLGSIV